MFYVLCTLLVCCVARPNKQWICCVLSFCCELVVCFLCTCVLCSEYYALFVPPCLSVRPAVRDHWGLWMWSLPENCSFMNDTRAFCSSSVSWVGGREGGRTEIDMCSTSAPATTATYLLSFNTLPFSLGLTSEQKLLAHRERVVREGQGGREGGTCSLL